MKYKQVKDLMTPNPVCILRHETLKQAHDLMREKNIRHIPVVDDNKVLVGMLTQKIMMGQVLKIISVFGPEALERKEKQLQVGEIMAADFESVEPEQSLKEIASFFVSNRHGCMPVIDESRHIKGILTSSDFVKLAAELLS